MSARYQIRHVSRFHYDRSVSVSFNEARLTPAATKWQNPLESTLRVEPATWQHRYVDYWGTQVRVFESSTTHRELVVDASSLVEIDSTLRPRADISLGWAEVRSPDVTEQFEEYLTEMPAVAPPEELATAAEQLAAAHPPNEAAHRLSGMVYDAMTYVPGSTGVHTLASEAWRARSGVCQDYAHLVVGALRHVGLPARYVSGYLHANTDGELGVASVGESHAWVEWWLGEWVGHDPTNSTDPGDRHIVVGTGRSYRDVPPIKGIVAGVPATTELAVTVETTQLA
jgi:transglutaminase-like putative cysteine protease